MVVADGQTLALLLFGAGVVLSIMEAVAPGAHFVVLGVALMVAGLVGLLFPPAAAPLVLAFLVFAVGAVALFAYRNLDVYGGKGSGRISDSETLVGKTGTVVDRVTRSSGRVRLDDGGFDPVYSARAMDGEIAEGSEIIVLDPGGGSVLTVSAVDDRDAIDRELDRGRRAREAGGDADPEAEAETEDG